MRQIAKREFLKLAYASGFKKIRCRGDHMVLRHPDGRQFTFVCVRPRSVVMHRLIKEFNLKGEGK